MKFFKAVRPEESIDLRAEKLGEVQGMVQFKVAATVNSVVVAEGQLVLSIAGSFAPGAE
jgi:3-hydroxymyristoyl/3-hydroxydecanoyl-(acyl carrier protein) dehydratase